MYGNEEKDQQIYDLYGKMSFKDIAKKLKCPIRHVRYVIYEKRKKRR
jgi:Mor family transcriptional regulator